MEKIIKKLLKESFDFNKSLKDFKEELNSYLSNYDWFDKVSVEVNDVDSFDVGGRVKWDTKLLVIDIYANRDREDAEWINRVNLDLYGEIDFLTDIYFPQEKHRLPVILNVQVVTKDKRRFLIGY
jgi:hypothetical protein